MLQILLWAAGLYALICGLGYLFHRHFIYIPDPACVAPADVGLAAVEEVEIEGEDGCKLVGWHAPAAPGRPTLLYWTGNAGSVARRAARLARFQADGYGALLMNYRGCGGSGGRASERLNVADGVAAHDWLTGRGVAAQDIVLYGESIGSGVAAQVAAVRPARAVVLEAPLTSTADVGRATWWFLPLDWILVDGYRTVDNIRRVRAPVLIVHGARDEVIPLAHGERVHAAANAPKKLAVFPEGRHSDLFDHGAWEEIEAFVAAAPAMRTGAAG